MDDASEDGRQLEPRPARRSSAAAVAAAVSWLDGGAVALFALEGATLAAAAGLDLFGVLVVAVVSSLAGGTVRDLLLGDVPPLSVRTSRYVLLALAGGTIAFAWFRVVEEVPTDLLVVLDAVGLGLFAVSGAAKATEVGVPAVICCGIGVLTAVGGGVVRDVLLDLVPVVLRAEIYATAALLGAVIVVVGLRLGLRRGPVLVVGAAACVALRLVAYGLEWNLPTAV
jgi:uncharacterized membrane protein YeiH